MELALAALPNAPNIGLEITCRNSDHEHKLKRMLLEISLLVYMLSFKPVEQIFSDFVEICEIPELVRILCGAFLIQKEKKSFRLPR